MHVEGAATDRVFPDVDVLAQRCRHQFEQSRKIVELQLVRAIVRGWPVSEGIANEQHIDALTYRDQSGQENG